MRCSSKTHFVRKSPNCSLCLIVKRSPWPQVSSPSELTPHANGTAADPDLPATISQISSTTLSRPNRADCATSSTASLSRPSPVLCADASPPTPIIYASHNPGHSVAKSAMSSRCRSAGCIIARSIARKEQQWWARVGIDPLAIAQKLRRRPTALTSSTGANLLAARQPRSPPRGGHGSS